MACTFASVFRAVGLEGENVAVKIPKAKPPAKPDRHKLIADSAAGLLRELSIHCLVGTKDVSHGVLPIRDVTIAQPPNADVAIGLVFQLAEGDLYSHVRENGCLNTVDLRQAAVCIFRGLRHVHACGVVHLDISGKNVLRIGRGDGNLYVLSDFGSASSAASPQISIPTLGGELGVQTRDYRAP